ncbi:lamin tail domain-containing protein [Rufibacter tibetensis]|uniref:LTD domain-containing protein n=1 Tax=Rufibacter tibetensis TaxID=512763 RepID=A0A0P0CU84_9BACT|nr:lamin tail domain-containing protein [Rufibacter tibetensis]ALI97883.1 hypothetical protein DC20_01440 [Rufibacter tibetensis]
MKRFGIITGLIISLSACTDAEEVEPKVPAAEQFKIVINEFMAANQSTLKDNAGEYDDWIEIHNTGDKAVNLGGLYISDKKANKTKYKIPATDPTKTTIEPGGYLILWADSHLEQGVLHLGFRLSEDGEEIGIYTAEGKTIDETTFGPQVTDISTGRLNSATNTWTQFTRPTPGSANVGVDNP